jgi:exonuclease SbcC
MIVEKLECSNWSKHEKVSFECDGGLVGVLGSNGAGKSSILDLLEFLITGETRDTLDSYVRWGTGNAWGRMRFRKNGKSGEIFRQVGKTSKRELIWDGQPPVTSAKKVDAMMSEIFGSDKKALANSVFVNQGTMEDVLFRAEGRTKAFIRLVNLSFCEQRARAVDGHIQAISSTMVDLTPARDEASAARQAAADTHQTHKQAMDACVDHSPELAYLRSLRQAINESDVLTRQLGEESNQLLTKRSELTTQLGEFSTLEDFQNQLALKRLEIGTARQTADDFGKVMAELTHYGRIHATLQNDTKENSRILQELRTANPDNYTAKILTDYVDHITDQIDIHVKRVDIQDQLLTLQKTLERQAGELAALPACPVTEDSIRELESQLSTVRSNLQTLQKWEGLQKTIAKKTATSSQSEPSDCPECGLTLLNLYALSPEKTAELATDIVETKKLVATLETQIRNHRNDLNAWNRKQSTLQGALQTTETSIGTKTAELQGQVVTEALDTLQTRKQEYRTLHDRIVALGESQRTVLTNITRSREQMKHYPLAAANWAAREQYTPEAHGQLNHALQTLELEIAPLQQSYNLAYGVQAQVQQLEKGIDQKEAQLEELGLAISGPKVGEFETLLAECNANMTELEAKLVNNEQYRESCASVAQASLEAYQAANTRFQDLELRMEQNKAKLLLIADLRRLKDVISDDGAPMLFVKQKFKTLARYTQASLASMHANFFINIDPDRDLCFQFQLLAEPQAGRLPMEKLSGGQKVRLCLSFLMALQKTLMQDVGLLVLDEPSVHVDIGGREQMAEFFVNMRQELKNSDHQVWVVDHDPIIGGALEKKLQL